MEYQMFLQLIENQLNSFFPEGTDIKICQIPKINGVVMDYVEIEIPGSTVSPSISAAPFYELYKKGVSIASILQKIADCYKSGMRCEKDLEDALCDSALIRKNAVCRLIGIKNNEKLLQEIPYRPYLDLAVIYYLRMDHIMDSQSNMMLRNEHMDLWDLSFEELDECARMNTKRLLPMRFESLEKIMDTLLKSSLPHEGEPGMECPLYVLTNSEQAYGAYWMTDREALEQIASQIGGDYYVLPSSVHECIILKNTGDWDEGGLVEMVTDINRACVLPQEVLANSVYRYQKDWGELRIVRNIF